MAWTLRQMDDFAGWPVWGWLSPGGIPCLNPVFRLGPRRTSFGPRPVANRAHRPSNLGRSARGRSRGAITRLDVGMGYLGSCQIISEHFGLTGATAGKGARPSRLVAPRPRRVLLLWCISGSLAGLGHRRAIHVPSQGESNQTRLAMNEKERHEIEALLPWHAARTLSRSDADRVEQALADDPELARRYDLVRQELAETIHLNETLGAPSARAMEKLFAAIDAEEAGAPRRRRRRISRPLSLGTAST